MILKAVFFYIRCQQSMLISVANYSHMHIFLMLYQNL